MKFDITSQMPTEEEIIKHSLEWLEPQKGLMIPEWNDKLKNISFDFIEIKLDKEKVKEAINGRPDHDYFHQEFTLAIAHFEGNVFVKTISRSPKDWFYQEKPLCKSSKDITDALFSSLRTSEDLYFLSNLDMCTILIRPFHEIPKQYEFRVLVYGRQIVGISQYHYDEKFQDVVDNENTINVNLRAFVDSAITPNVPLNHFVADIFFDFKKYEYKLIELNPFGLSDPCLFGSYDNLDGTFKYIK